MLQTEPIAKRARRHPPAAQPAPPESIPVVVRPPLKWAGGKRWQVQHLRKFWEPQRHRRLVEPFCGGLAVTIGLAPTRALLNDVNPHLINFYTWLKRGFRIFLRMRNDSATYYASRQRFNLYLHNGGAHSKEVAGLFYYLNRTGYNGLCRFNRQGGFNVPFGRYTKISYKRNFLEFKELFRSWDFVNLDFEAVPLCPDDFIYADPPYDVEFTQYSKQVFGWDEQVRAAQWLARHPGPVILSNQETPRIVSLYKELGYHLHYLSAPRLISCTGDRTRAREVLATRNL